MKNNNSNNSKKKTFLRLPTYPGGKLAFMDFISKNLVYPAEALEKQIQGFVYIEYDVDSLGKLFNAFVKKGIGYGCDEEAIRVINLLEYDAVKNRGIRMKTHMKTRIRFNLPETIVKTTIDSPQINYLTTTPINKNKQASEDKPAYSYTITIG